MTYYLDPTGQPTYGIGLCARCSKKFLLAELHSDPNSPGLMVCKEDLDDLDPYRYAPPPVDQVVLPFVRPDEPLDSNGPAVFTLLEDIQGSEGSDLMLMESGTVQESSP